MQAQVGIRTWFLKQNDWLQDGADLLLKKGEMMHSMSPPIERLRF